jgi:hypothetical protein
MLTVIDKNAVEKIVIILPQLSLYLPIHTALN